MIFIVGNGQWPEFKPWMRLFASSVLILLGKKKKKKKISLDRLTCQSINHLNFYNIAITPRSTNPLPSQSGHESNDNEEVLHILKISMCGDSPSDGLVPYPRNFLRVGVSPLCRNAVGVFYGASCLSWKYHWTGLNWTEKNPPPKKKTTNFTMVYASTYN